MPEIRLGDVIDDYCSRCRLLSNHSVVSLLEGEVKKVRCRTCNHEHNYRHGRKAGRRRPQPTAYEQVLASITGVHLGAAEPEKDKTLRKRK